MFTAHRVTEYWQRAAVYYIRMDEFVYEFDIGVEHELDERDSPNTPYILVLDDHGKPAIPAFHKTCELGRLLADSMEQGGVIGFFRPYYERILPKADLEALWADDGKRRALSTTPEDYLSEISPCIWNSPDRADRDPLTSGPALDVSVNPLKGLL